MERKNQPFCNTAAVLKTIKELDEFKANSWHGFTGGTDTFTDLQSEIRNEREYLKGFWNEKGTTIDDKKFIGWKALPAYDDTPENHKVYTKKVAETKYDILHDRERYLENLFYSVFSLYHDWHFVTQGWTAY